MSSSFLLQQPSQEEETTATGLLSVSTPVNNAVDNAVVPLPLPQDKVQYEHYKYYALHGNHPKVLFTMAVAIPDSDQPNNSCISSEIKPYTSYYKLALFTPINNFLKNEICRCCELSPTPGSKKDPELKGWTKPKCLTWLKKHPIMHVLHKVFIIATERNFVKQQRNSEDCLLLAQQKIANKMKLPMLWSKMYKTLITHTIKKYIMWYLLLFIFSITCRSSTLIYVNVISMFSSM